MFTNKFDFILPENSYLHDSWPEFILKEVEGFVPEFHTFPWLSIVTPTNSYLYKGQSKEEFWSDVYNSGLTLVPNDFTTCYGLRDYDESHLAFHYDGFNYCGYAYMLKKLPFYDRLEPIISKYFNYDRIIPHYWKRRILGQI